MGIFDKLKKKDGAVRCSLVGACHHARESENGKRKCSHRFDCGRFDDASLEKRSVSKPEMPLYPPCSLSTLSLDGTMPSISMTGSSSGAKEGALAVVGHRRQKGMTDGGAEFFFLCFLPFRPPLSNSFSQASAAAAATAAAAPTPAPSKHATTDTELANSTPRADPALLALLHKADAPVESVVDLVGGTPMVRLRRSVPPEGAVVLAKLESLQPNSSVKDR